MSGHRKALPHAREVRCIPQAETIREETDGWAEIHLGERPRQAEIMGHIPTAMIKSMEATRSSVVTKYHVHFLALYRRSFVSMLTVK